MKYILKIIVFAFICLFITSNYSLACHGCFHECNDYTKHIKNLEEPDKSIALGLWFGAYSTKKVKDEPERNPDKRIMIDDRVRQYFKFWNNNADYSMMTEQDKMQLYIDPDGRKKISIPLPDINETATVHIATKETSKDGFGKYNDFMLDQISVNNSAGKGVSARIAIKLFGVEMQAIGGKMESGWGTTNRSAKPFFEKVIDIDAAGYDLKLKQYLDKNVKYTDRQNYIGVVMQVTTQKISVVNDVNSDVTLKISQSKMPLSVN